MEQFYFNIELQYSSMDTAEESSSVLNQSSLSSLLF